MTTLPAGMPTRDPNRQTDKSPTYDSKRGGYYPPAPAPQNPPTGK